jgi:hypothetical protein
MKLRLSITLAVATLAVATGTVSLATGASAPPSGESWADTEHGWRMIGRQNMLGAYPAMQATENGGRTWRTIQRQPRYGIAEIQRTTSTDGIAFVPRPRKPVLVTVDNGRHWQALPLVPRGFPVQASGRDLFWLTPQGTALRRLSRMRNALLGRTRTTVAASLPQNWIFEAVQPVPGGAAAIANKSQIDNSHLDESVFGLVVYRYGRARTFTIVRGTTPLVCPGSVHTFSIEWPVVTIVADEVSPDPGPLGSCTFASRTITFVSTDGGVTWTATSLAMVGK